MDVSVDETPHQWRLLKVEYTPTFSDGLDPNPALVREIRSFDPKYVPLLVRRVMQAPGTGGVVAFGYHVLGRHVALWADDETPLEPVRLMNVPTAWPYAAGTIYAMRTWSFGWKKGSYQARNAWPDLYLPHDSELVAWMRACHRQMYDLADSIQSRIKREMRERLEAEQKELDETQAKAKGKLHDDRHELSDAIANHLHWMEHPRQMPAPEEPKPVVDLGARGPLTLPDNWDVIEEANAEEEAAL